MNPSFAEAFYGRGFAYGIKGEYDRAIADFDAAIKFKGAWSAAFSARGEAYAAKGQNDRAVADLEQAIRLSSADPQCASRSTPPAFPPDLLQAVLRERPVARCH